MSRVLFVNQTATMSGAEHSLLSLLSGLPAESVAGVACPPGDLSAALAAMGVPVWPLEGTAVSFRLHPRYTTRGLARIAADAARLRMIARSARADIVHANTARAGLITALAGFPDRLPVIVHLRDWLPPGRLPQVTVGVLRSRAAALIVNSRHIRDNLPNSFGNAPVHVVHNPVDLARFDADRIDVREARARFGFAPDDLVLTILGQITPWKAQDDAVRIAAMARKQLPNVKLLIAGSAKFTDPGTRFDNLGFERGLRALVSALALDDVVVFAGERDDVPHVLRATDLQLVPSWEEAFGRVALEGMAMGVPVIVTSRGGPAEMVDDDVEGRILDPRSPHRWGKAVIELLANAERRDAMGRCGRARARAEFSIDRHAAAVAAIHAEVARR